MSLSTMTNEGFEKEKAIHQASLCLSLFFFSYVNKRGHIFLAYMGIHSIYDLGCEKFLGKYLWSRMLTLLPGELEQLSLYLIFWCPSYFVFFISHGTSHQYDRVSSLGTLTLLLQCLYTPPPGRWQRLSRGTISRNVFGLLFVMLFIGQIVTKVALEPKQIFFSRVGDDLSLPALLSMMIPKLFPYSAVSG